MRIVGWLAAILGVVGVVVCLAIAVGVWVVRPHVGTRIDHIASVAVEGLEQAAALSSDASELSVQVGARLDRLAAAATTAADSPILDAAVDRALSASITTVVTGPWNQLQERLGGMRERVVGISTVVQALDDAIPFVSLPGTVTGVIDDVDARWSSVDERMAGLEQVATDGVGTASKAREVAQTATDASARLVEVNQALGQVHVQIEATQGDIEHAADQADSVLTWVAAIVCVIAVWVGLLHLLLIAQGRRWIRGEG
ncbi:MAG: hypothetical protein U0667_01940 [Chloroflexota bacterium]